ncbi:uncharacterized protein LOC126982137 isoform X2 [Eriocheir sinensis]|uniref:uncharacterized protein LOC126982137 isoform X2 n=1 Tax=Eriocheir sinensis TaxID=95602 RepID=UPI0021C685C7|nr:uncharacterized protein LOC126982137 isoform X2 [Eriocheir sinensis]
MNATPDVEEVAEEYRSSLRDLVNNSKPLITMLTMLAEENRAHAAVIVKVIEEHIHEIFSSSKVGGTQKLPTMYLIDSIMKNVGSQYIKLFAHNIIPTFCCVFEKVDERTRKKLYELRTTWNEVFAKSKLYGLDVKVQAIDPAWPLPVVQPSSIGGAQPTASKHNIHINPNIIKPGGVKTSTLSTSSTQKNQKDMEILKLKREEELLSLERKKLMLEKKKILLQQSRHGKPEVEGDKSASPVSGDPSISSERRSQFLRTYKIKKKAQGEEEPKGPNIHLDPRRVHQVLPLVTAAPPSPLTPSDTRSRGGEAISRDPRLAQDNRAAGEASRDPRLNTEGFRADPRLASHTPEVAPKASRDPRLAGKEAKDKEKKEERKEKEKKKEHHRSSSKKDFSTSSRDSKKKKETSSKSSKSPSSSSSSSSSSTNKSTHHEKDTTTSTIITTTTTATPTIATTTSVSTSKAFRKSSTPEVSEGPATFKSDRRSRQRTYKKREESPEDLPEPQAAKRSRVEITSDSDSDHYDANRPSPALYNKTVKKVDSGNLTPPSTTTTTTTSTVADTDYRQFTSPPTKTEGNLSPPKKDSLIDELFSKKEDVDYRQLLPQPGMLPTATLPAAFKMADQDERTPALDKPHHPPREPLAPLNKDPNLSPHHPKVEPSTPVTPALSEIERSRKLSFNSPHAASWEKFRQKNPEFKEYQRQASTSEPERGFMPMEVDQDMPFCSGASPQPPPNARGHQFPGRPFEEARNSPHAMPRDGPWPPYDEEGRRGFMGRNKATQENFKMILEQAQEQRDRGEISEAQYQHMANQLRLFTEQEQIREARERERMQHRPHGPQQQQPPPPQQQQQQQQQPQPPPPQPPFKVRFPPTGAENDWGGGRGRGMSDNFRGGGRGGFMGPGMHQGPRNMGRGGRFDEEEGGGWGRGGGRGGWPWRGGRHPRDERGGMSGNNNSGGGGGGGGGGWGQRDGGMLEDEWTGEPDLPYVSEEALKAAAREAETRTIEIDGVPREIRTYGETAVILLDWNDPRILTFGDGHCNIVFDGGKFMLPMRLGEDYKEFTIDGETHRVKLGVPTQELMLDGRGYQCFFGGKPITVHLAGQPRTVCLDGKPPTVNIGPVTNTEFVAGKVQLVIHARKVVNLFLDAKPQRFNIDGKPFVLQFTDGLRAVTINNVRFPVEFGGLPISISVRGFRRFLRFTSLPQGVLPGKVLIRGMETEAQKKAGLPPQPPPGADKFLPDSQSRGSPALDMARKPPFNPMEKPPVPPHLPVGLGQPGEGVFGMHQGPVPHMGPNAPCPVMPVPPQHPHPMPSGPMPSGPMPPQGPPQIPTSLPQLAQQLAPAIVASQGGPLPLPGVAVPTLAQPVVPLAVPGAYMTTQIAATTFKPSQPKPLDLSALLENLTRTGLITTKPLAAAKSRRDKDEADKKKEEEAQREKDELIPFEAMFTSENLRRRRGWLIEYLYRGMQCSSCGLRYPPEQTLQYSHHLDWHFRQNKKQQESTKKANIRKFYFSVQDWLQYEEIEDVEERVPSMFETEGMEGAMEAEDTEEPSVAVSSDTALGICPACHDTFSQFFHQETEEWRYHNAIQVEGINYHPACHQDLLRAEAAEKEEEEQKKKEEEEAAENKEKVEKKKEEEEEEEEGAEEKKKEEEGEDAEKKKEEEEEKEKEASVTGTEDKEKEKEGDNEEEKEKEKGEDAQVNGEKENGSTEGEPATTEMLLPIRIKEEPMDVEEVDVDETSMLSLPEGVTVKQEVKQEPLDEDDPSSLIPAEGMEVDGDSQNQDGEGRGGEEEEDEEEEEDHFVSPAVNAAETDIASSIDGNMELPMPTDTLGTRPTIGKIRLNISKPMINNNNNNNNNNTNSNDNEEEADSAERKKRDALNSSSIDEEGEDFVPPPFTVDLDLKPGFEGVELDDQPVLMQGVEMSGLCSIM